MKVSHIERYTIPLGHNTKVYDVYKALGKMPHSAVLHADHGCLYATYENEPIDPTD